MPSAAVVQVVEHEEAYLHKNQSRLIMYVHMYAEKDEQSSDKVPNVTALGNKINETNLHGSDAVTYQAKIKKQTS